MDLLVVTVNVNEIDQEREGYDKAVGGMFVNSPHLPPNPLLITSRGLGGLFGCCGVPFCGPVGRIKGRSVCWVLVVAHTSRIVPHYYCVLLPYSVFWISARNQNVRQARQIDVCVLPASALWFPSWSESE